MQAQAPHARVGRAAFKLIHVHMSGSPSSSLVTSFQVCFGLGIEKTISLNHAALILGIDVSPHVMRALVPSALQPCSLVMSRGCMMLTVIN